MRKHFHSPRAPMQKHFHGLRDHSACEKGNSSGCPPEPFGPRDGHRLSSRPEEFHLWPLTEPDVNLSIHPALIVQPLQAEGPSASGQIARGLFLRFLPANIRPSADGILTSCISSSPTTSVCDSGVGKSDKAPICSTCRSS